MQFCCVLLITISLHIIDGLAVTRYPAEDNDSIYDGESDDIYQNRRKRTVDSTMTLSGHVLVPIDVNLPEASCMTVLVQKDILCMHCQDVPVIGKQVYHNITQNVSGHISFELQFEASSTSYTVSATINIGWCSSGESNQQWIRPGDFTNDQTVTFAISPEQHDSKKQLIILKEYTTNVNELTTFENPVDTTTNNRNEMYDDQEIPTVEEVQGGNAKNNTSDGGSGGGGGRKLPRGEMTMMWVGPILVIVAIGLFVCCFCKFCC